MDEWHRQKAIYQEPEQHSLMEVGFATFFLNRTNRSGILNGGVIGGKEQTGNFKLDARFNKVDLTNRIRRIARYKERINLYNWDAAEFIQVVLPQLPVKALVYLDPPYYLKGKELYDNHYSHQDHAVIAELVKTRVNQKWIVSYDNVPAICQFYDGCPTTTYSLHYSATERYAGSEVMFFCKQLVIPWVSNPTRVKSNQIAKMMFQ